MAKTADKPSRSSSSPAGVTKKSTKSKPVAAAAKKTMKTNPMAAIKNSLKGKAPRAAGKSKSAASSSSSGKGSSAAKKSDANIVSSVCRQANEVLGKDLDSKKVSGLAVKGMVEPVCRMLGKDYGVDSPKSLALAMVILADANLLTDPVRMKQLGLAAFTDNQMATVKVYQDLLAGEVADHEAVIDLAAKTSEASGLPKHSQVAVLGWMVVVASKLSGVRPGRVQRLPSGKLEGLTPLEKKKRVGTFQLLSDWMVKGGRLGNDAAACKKLCADLAQICSKF